MAEESVMAVRNNPLERLRILLQRQHMETKQSISEVEFLGWQETLDGGAVALYVINAPQHPLYRSTVTEKTLREFHLEVPPTPAREDRSGNSSRHPDPELEFFRWMHGLHSAGQPDEKSSRVPNSEPLSDRRRKSTDPKEGEDWRDDGGQGG